MSNFIKIANQPAVNLELVTEINPTIDKKIISFRFDSISNSKDGTSVNMMMWEFKTEEEFISIYNQIKLHAKIRYLN